MCVNPIRTINPRTHEVMFLPCGHCHECVEKIRNGWSKRIADSIHSVAGNYGVPFGYFVTLTYNNQNLPLITNESIIDDGLGISTTPYTTRVYTPYDKNNPAQPVGYNYERRDKTRYISTSPDGIHGFLCRKDVQTFQKRLRKMLWSYYHLRCSFFGCGEYGGDAYNAQRHTFGTSRPHYHFAIWFEGLKGNKEILGYNCNNRSDALFQYQVPMLTSTAFKMLVDKAWNKSSGRTLVVEPIRNIEATSRYITKYILKEMEQHKHRNDYCCQRVPMFRIFSQHIGIEGAIQYLNKLQKDLESGIVELPVYHKVCLIDGATKQVDLALPRYYVTYAFKQLGKHFDGHIDDDCQPEVQAAYTAIRELWNKRIEELEQENPQTEEKLRLAYEKSVKDIDMYLRSDGYSNIPDYDHKAKERKSAFEHDVNSRRVMEENSKTNDFIFDNPYCMDAQIEMEKLALEELRKLEYPFEIGMLEECPF